MAELYDFDDELDEDQLNDLIDSFLDSKPKVMYQTLGGWSERIHELNKTWWHDPKTGEPLQRNIGEMLMLVTSELAEALEGHRKQLMDDKLPQYKNFDVEIADAFIRLFDICGGLGIDIDAIVEAKLAYNAQRADHKPENRIKPGGKTY